MRRRSLALTTLFLSTLVGAQQTTVGMEESSAANPPTVAGSKDPQSQARAFQNLVLDGKQVSAGIKKLRKELKWHSNLGTAAAQARKENKPIIWIQALGKLGGYT
ncbi:MAG: hypothetical protein ACYTG5_22505 [Planctomycetota bacterium]|jgi:hypothetical protein